MGPRLATVAEAARVSTATASKALRGLPGVNDSTAERVRREADRLNYVQASAGSHLATGRSGSIALLLHRLDGWYSSRLLEGVERTCQEHGYSLIIRAMDPSAPDLEREVERLGRVADGVLDASYRRGPRGGEGLGIPRVPIVRVDDGSGAEASVDVDHHVGGRLAAQHLVNFGHERIAVLAPSNGPSADPWQRCRAGFLEVLSESSLPLTQVDELEQIRDPRSAAAALRSAGSRDVTAVFCASDELAFGALNGLRSSSPEEGRGVSVVGYGGHALAADFGLTTVVEPVSELGSAAADELFEQLRTGRCLRTRRTLEPHLVVRSSSRLRRWVNDPAPELVGV
jgi:LacI family transcriptional regulator, repressor for deo operon, udp, cdd, tsx, nupC, and nupG